MLVDGADDAHQSAKSNEHACRGAGASVHGVLAILGVVLAKISSLVSATGVGSAQWD